MKVLPGDLRNLLNEAIVKFEKNSKTKSEDYKLPDLYEKLCLDIEDKVGIKLNPQTVYKQAYIRLKSWDKSNIGISLDILNGLSKYVYSVEYTERYIQVFDEESAIPEFPWNHPSFPATPAIPIKIPGYNNIWIKDESINPTGVHKDRMAWEVYLFYKNKITEDNKKGLRIKLPRLSIISNGNAALSIQNLLNEFGFPNLKVIYDPKIVDPNIIEAMKNSKCELYPENLQKVHLSSKRILEITENQDGIDLTEGDSDDGHGNNTNNIDKINLYDWLAYEILNLNPTYCFIPYGSGEVLRNILEINRMELKNSKPTKRFFGNKDLLSNCCFIGARAKDINTQFKMLYAKFNRFQNKDFDHFLESEVCSKKSKIEYLDEKLVMDNPYKKGIKQTILELASSIADKHNINHEPSGISGLAMFMQLKDQLGIKENDKVVILNTGKIKLELFK